MFGKYEHLILLKRNIALQLCNICRMQESEPQAYQVCSQKGKQTSSTSGWQMTIASITVIELARPFYRDDLDGMRSCLWKIRKHKI